MFARLPPALVLTLAIIAGSAMDATIKHLMQSNHVLLVSFGRYLFGAFFSLLIWWRAGRPTVTKEMWRAHGLRGFVIAICAVTFFWSLKVLPLAEAVTLSFIYPLLAPFVAFLILKERIRASSVICALVGFGGVLLAMQGAPSEAESPLHDLGVIAALLAATFFSLAMVLLRERAQKDGPVIVSLMTSVVPGLILFAPTLAYATPPNFDGWWFFLQLGALAAVFMYLMAQAYARAEAQQLAPIHYTELIYASLIGFFLFHEVPRPEIYMGAALIIAACLWAAYDERRLSLKPKEKMA
ncbi:MAG: DMT family transporter [Alphaproteobacteria bacterium]|nr:DMT family transporter [Alphaproteobacteria bacterium]